MNHKGAPKLLSLRKILRKYYWNMILKRLNVYVLNVFHQYYRLMKFSISRCELQTDPCIGVYLNISWTDIK